MAADVIQLHTAQRQADTAQLGLSPTAAVKEKHTHLYIRMASPRLALAVIVLVLAVISLTEGMRGAGPKRCCTKFNEKPLKKERVVSYIRTSQRCPVSAIRFKTVAGLQLCARSSAPWAKELVSYLDAKSVPGETSNL